MTIQKDTAPARHETFLRLKAIDTGDGERWIEGIATTARQDRVGDIVEPTGAKFTLPLPLLANHDHGAPIGVVTEAKVTSAGIRIRAKLSQGVARANEIWQLIKDGAMSLSIGFQSLKSTPLPNGGLRFDSWSWHELSCVAVPANPDARVAVAKCIAYRTASSTPAPVVDHAWIKATEPQRQFETELQAHYRKFDSAVALLPRELREQCDVRRVQTTKGVMTFTNADGDVVATVDMKNKHVSLGSELPATSSTKPKAAPRQTGITEAALKGIVTGIAQALAEQIKKLTTRLDALEAAHGKGLGDGALEHHARLDAVERRLAEIEPFQMRYRGIWSAAHNYAKGDIVSSEMKTFYAVAPSEPGDEKPSRSSRWSIMFHANTLTNPR
ncbi:MAG: HK97 family phage prohead protease [Rudaea sp.]|uniref:HK97 family phage prohead protease n=1 Tax=Rudaea sp. TaxID=2136325 RepID=UPI0039E58DCE